MEVEGWKEEEAMMRNKERGKRLTGKGREEEVQEGEEEEERKRWMRKRRRRKKKRGREK